MYNYPYRFPDYGEAEILGNKIIVNPIRKWLKSRINEDPSIAWSTEVLPFLTEISSNDEARRFFLEIDTFEVEFKRIAECGALPDTLIENLANPDLYNHITQLIYVYEDGKLYYRKVLVDILYTLYQTIVSKRRDQSVSITQFPEPKECVRGFVYLNEKEETENEIGINDKLNSLFGVKLAKTHPYIYNEQYADYRVYSETDPNKSNTFCINLPEAEKVESFFDPNFQILYHIIPVIALAPNGSTFSAAVINTANRGFEFVGIQSDGTLISYGPVNVPILMGDLDQPRGVYIPTDTPEPMKAVFKGIMNKVEERLRTNLPEIVNVF